MSERQARRFRQELRKRFKSDFDEFTTLIQDFSAWSRLMYCLELLFGKVYKRIRSIFKREKKRGGK